MADPEKGSLSDEVALQLSDTNKRWLEALSEAASRERILKERLEELKGILREKVAELERTRGVLRERIVELEGINSMLRGKLETIVNSKEAGLEEVELMKQQMIAEKFILIAAVEMLVSGIEGENFMWKEDLAEVARIARSILDLDLREITQVKCMQGMQLYGQQTKPYKTFCWGHIPTGFLRHWTMVISTPSLTLFCFRQQTCSRRRTSPRDSPLMPPASKRSSLSTRRTTNS